MMQKFTPNDLVRFIYKETSATETLAILDALNADAKLANIYEDLINGYSRLPKVKFAPHTSVLDNIMAYSKQTSFETQL